MNRSARIAVAVAGLLATPFYWGLIFLLVLSFTMGDCAASPAHKCLSGEITSGLAWAALVSGTVVYGLLIAAWRKLDDRWRL